MKYDYEKVIKLLKEILYVLEREHLLPFIQLDRSEGSLINQTKSAIEILRKEKNHK